MSIQVPDNFPNKVEQRLKKEFSKHFNEALAAQKAKELVQQNTPSSPYSIGNACWFITASALFYYAEYPAVLLYDPRVKSVWLNVGLILCAITIVIAAFLICWISWIKKISSRNWERLYPAAIPTATGAFIVGGICLTVAVWPVWGMFTPIIHFILFMGIIVTIVIIPGGGSDHEEKKED